MVPCREPLTNPSPTRGRAGITSPASAPRRPAVHDRVASGSRGRVRPTRCPNHQTLPAASWAYQRTAANVVPPDDGRIEQRTAVVATPATGRGPGRTVAITVSRLAGVKYR